MKIIREERRTMAVSELQVLFLKLAHLDRAAAVALKKIPQEGFNTQVV